MDDIDNNYYYLLLNTARPLKNGHYCDERTGVKYMSRHIVRCSKYVEYDLSFYDNILTPAGEMCLNVEKRLYKEVQNITILSFKIIDYKRKTIIFCLLKED